MKTLEREIAAGEFKAKCLALMDEVAARRESLVITKNGTPVVRMVPLDLAIDEDPLDAFHFPGLEIVGDVMAPIYTDEEWEEFARDSIEELK